MWSFTTRDIVFSFVLPISMINGRILELTDKKCASYNQKLIAHPNCKQFYKCDGDELVTYTCPQKLLYNIKAHKCDWPDNVDCSDRNLEPEENKFGEFSVDINEGEGNNDPSQAAAICAYAGSNGILISHKNCAKYYKCIDGKTTVHHCPSNFVYHPVKEWCDWPDNVECGDRTLGEDIEEDEPNEIKSTTEDQNQICFSEASDGILIAHDDIKKFYRCSNGKPVEMSCKDGLFFNPTKKQCDWPENLDSIHRQDIDDDDNIADTNEANRNNDNYKHFGNSDPDEAKSLCSAEQSNGVYIAHELCTKFYKCYEGKPVEFTCQGGLFYNPIIEQCDWQTNVDCGSRTISEYDSNEYKHQNPSNIKIGYNADYNQVHSICLAPKSDGTLVAHEHCESYYKCTQSQRVTLTCTAGLLYNPINEQCDWPENVDCAGRLTDAVPDEKDKHSNNFIYYSKEINREEDYDDDENISVDSSTTVCAYEASEGTLVAHGICNKFYICSEGKAVVTDCPAPLLFNAVKKQCDWKNNVDCGERIRVAFAAIVL